MRLLPALCLPALLAGCTVGPNYAHPPKVAGADAPWIAPVAPGAVDSAWWHALNDPMLDTLVDAAVAGNLDVREAEARLREARANRDAAAGAALPQVRATASATGNQLSANGQLPLDRLPGFSRRFSLFDAGFDASWEVDLWGGTRRAVEGATARAREAADHAEDVRLQTIAELVRTYAELRSAQARLASVQADVAVRAEIVGLVDQRFRAGEGSASDLAAAKQRADATRATVPGIEAQIRGAIYRLGLLSGRPPEALLTQLEAGAAPPEPPAIVAAGIRSDLLERRADIRAADADLAAATADIGVETANLYPHLSLMGSIGQQAQHLGDLASGSSNRFQIGPSFSWPIFSFGRIHAQIRAADARADEAAARYEKAVIGALTDSETALNRYAATQTTRAAAESALGESSTAAGLAERRFRAGEDDRIAWLEAQSARLAAEQQLLAARADALTAYVAVAKSLGGSWPEN